MGMVEVALSDDQLAVVDSMLEPGVSRGEWIAELVRLALLAKDSFDSAERGSMGERLRSGPGRVDPAAVSSTLGGRRR